ncbi:PE-PPE domain-containing protein [Mycolicibacter nonchromogenicus]|uniref:PE-PPE domain-containing protein n=1 Tax=Mycolicibacter nonchromogenicus TaxID=1782 RepID=UPI000A14C4C4|nr:PE-PPE domain-containing protein [Mycolicibacter nonchromogenicus]
MSILTVRQAHSIGLTVGIACAGIAGIPAAAAEVPLSEAGFIQFTAGGTALVYDGSGSPVPDARYLDAVNALYLQPNGFTGAMEPGFVPDGLYPITGIRTLGFGTSAVQGQSMMFANIQSHLATGEFSSENPLVVVGYSQTSTVASMVMSQLQEAGVPSDVVRFVLLGDPSNPNGGMLTTFDLPSGNTGALSALDVPIGPPTPSNLYATDVYTIEYDAAADFPHYPLNLLSVLNALVGNFTEHFIYADITPEQVADAILLPGSATLTGEGLTDYYMIPNPDLPLLMPLLLIPWVGQPLYNLLEPVTRILVNLGYGSITEGWNQGPANVATTFGLFPQIDLGQLAAALGSGVQQGFTDALDALANPVSYEEQLAPLMPFANAFYTHGFIDQEPTSFDDVLEGLLRIGGFPVSEVTWSSPPSEIIDMLSNTLAYDYSALVPAADAINALLTSLPAYAANILFDQLGAGDLLEAIGLPVAAYGGLVPLDALNGVAPALFAVLGTVDNLFELFF